MVSEIHNMGPCLLKPVRTVIFNIQKDHSVPCDFKKEVYIIYVDKSNIHEKLSLHFENNLKIINFLNFLNLEEPVCLFLKRMHIYYKNMYLK